MRKNHKFFSNLAFNLAENHLGKTHQNPSVGCLIVKDNAVISSGVTSLKGRPHAEFNALNKKINFEGADMYVTLEPCSHYGLTPPCTNIIKKKKIKKVFYAYNDPDKRSYKKAKKILKKRNISLIKLSTTNNFYKSYFLNKKKDLPLIDAKLAISKDFYSINKKKRWITNSRSRKVGQLLRSKYDCIVSTSETINKDNPLLNCRIDGFDFNKPDLIIIDRYLKLRKNLKLLKIAKKRKTYIFTMSQNNRELNYFRNKGCKIINIKKLSKKNDFNQLIKKIFKIGKRRVLVESGLVFLNELIKFRCVNNFFIFRSNKKLMKNGFNNTINNRIKKYKYDKSINVNLIDDKLFKIRVN